MISLSLHLKYGKALHHAALEMNADDKVLADVEAAASLLKDKHLKMLMQQLCYLQPEVSHKVLKATFEGKLHGLVLNLLVLLARQKAIKYLPKVAEVYKHAYYEAKGIHELTIRTAREFSPQEQLSFVEKLQSKKKQPVSVKFEVDASLIGGAQVYEGSDLTDYSVKNYLETLKKHLLQNNNY